MTYQIDQSGKIEDTAKDTVLAFSNGHQYSRRQGMTRLFLVHLFSLGIYYLIRNLKNSTHIIIDIEYPGKDRIIKSLLTDLLKLNKKPSHHINFSRIGNNPRVHYAAKDVFNGKTKPSFVLDYREIMKHQKSRWAFKRMSFNPGRRSAPAITRSIPKTQEKSIQNHKS